MAGVLWTLTKSRSLKTQKRTRPISSHRDRASWVNEGFTKWLKRRFLYAGPTQEMSSWQDGPSEDKPDVLLKNSLCKT